jgi:hypothetical protein
MTSGNLPYFSAIAPPGNSINERKRQGELNTGGKFAAIEINSLVWIQEVKRIVQGKFRAESSPKAGEVTLVSWKAMHRQSRKTSSIQTVADGFPSATI